MSRAALLLALPVMLACSTKEAPPADTSSAVTASATGAGPAMNVAGRWSVRVMPEDKDTTLLIYMLDATNERTGWKMTLPNRRPMDMRVLSMDGDSIVVENGPYSSALRQNVQVTTHSALWLDGDKLVGKTVARYATKGADSVVRLRTEGTR